jgi:hypothetical protein
MADLSSRDTTTPYLLGAGVVILPETTQNFSTEKLRHKYSIWLSIITLKRVEACGR